LGKKLKAVIKAMSKEIDARNQQALGRMEASPGMTGQAFEGVLLGLREQRAKVEQLYTEYKGCVQEYEERQA
jgi:hypothetical protein